MLETTFFGKEELAQFYLTEAMRVATELEVVVERRLTA